MSNGRFAKTFWKRNCVATLPPLAGLGAQPKVMSLGNCQPSAGGVAGGLGCAGPAGGLDAGEKTPVNPGAPSVVRPDLACCCMSSSSSW